MDYRMNAFIFKLDDQDIVFYHYGTSSNNAKHIVKAPQKNERNKWL